MTVALTERDTKNRISGDNYSKHYKCVITSETYPTDGIVIEAADYPSAEADFSHVWRVWFPGGNIDANGYLYSVDPDDFDNSDTDDPTFKLKIWEAITGGSGYTEVPNSTSFSGTINLVVEGVPQGGVIDTVNNTW